ncbi:MAG: hypothetical protein WED00_02725 [Aquisalimonadaceae bacterium]
MGVLPRCLWTTLSSSIAGGLTFATILTLVLTPCMLMLGENVSERLRLRRQRAAATENAESAMLEKTEPGHEPETR